jgi:uncharacterized protein Smg (DUF494 family)
MQGKLIEILIILMREINNRGVESGQMELISGELLNLGFTEHEISTAFSYVIERMNLLKDAPEPDPRSFRVLHDIERVFLSAEAYGYLLQLQKLGLLSIDEMEKIIERAVMMSTPKLGVNEVKSIVVDILFDDNELTGFEGENVIPEDIVH